MNFQLPQNFTIRPGSKNDVPSLLLLIKGLAYHEGLPQKVIATEDLLIDQLFTEPRTAQFVIAEFEGRPVGYALYFYTFSTYLGKRGLYLEDLFILPEMRGKGYGKALFKYVAQIATEERCGRMEWSVVNWNESAIGFYTKLGAVQQSDKTVYRLDSKSLRSLLQ